MQIKNIIYIPYHDWRKILTEGNRTRDAHFIEQFRSDNTITNLIIINRPITYSELLVKKKLISKNLSGEIVLKSGNFSLYKIDDKTFIIDSFLNNNLKQILKGRKWFFEAFANKKLHDFLHKSFVFLNIKNPYYVSANIFSSGLFTKKQQPSNIVFDAWDNFYKMPGLASIKKEIFESYKSFSLNAPLWITNSDENKLFFKEHFGLKKIEIVKNGVDFKLFKKKLPLPKDLKSIRVDNKPIIGFGGKITHLFDSSLFNYIARKNEDYNFVIIGQILDKKVFSKIIKRKNVFYLGDKTYDVYPNYITNFDIGIIPYKTGNTQHGGDTIKAYEYLAAGLPVVGTNGNGLQNLKEYIFLADSKELFDEALKKASFLKRLPEKEFSWKRKKDQLLSLLNPIH